MKFCVEVGHSLIRKCLDLVAIWIFLWILSHCPGFCTCWELVEGGGHRPNMLLEALEAS